MPDVCSALSKLPAGDQLLSCGTARVRGVGVENRHLTAFCAKQKPAFGISYE